jgi:Flp pilus assembly protein TadG
MVWLKNMVLPIFRQQAGNVLAITALSLPIILGLTGGALDIGRGYLAKARLQQACDAGALAGRNELNSTTWPGTAKTMADTFFTQNFPAGQYGTANLVYAYTADSTKKVTGTASVEVPTSAMKLVGKDKLSIAIKCSAETQMPNVDIMFALDTTESMDITNSGDSKSRIGVLRDAVTSFYNALEAAKVNGSQVRYGFVPYSNNVNVGHLLKPEWLVDSASYQSRRADGMDNPTTWILQSESWYDWTYISGSVSTTYTVGPEGNCVAPNSSGSVTNPSDWAISDTTVGGVRTVIKGHRETQTGTVYWTDTSSGQCRIYKSVRNKYREEHKYKAIYELGKPMWWYDSIAYNVTPLKSNVTGSYLNGTGSITANIGYRQSARTINWNGCIEERQTVNTNSFSTIPAGAYDLNIDLVPTADAATRWKPALSSLIYARWDLWNWNVPGYRDDSFNTNIGDEQNGRLAICPSKAARLKSLTSSELSTYLNGLVTGGTTYHDIGMIWAARLLSAEGLYATDNQTSTNGGTIARHLILMTDGQTEPDMNGYGAYGYEALDRRRTTTTGAPTNADIGAIVDKRFQAVCAAARGKFTVWVIAFGTTLSQNLIDCASPNSSFQANNAAQLNAAFTSIAGKISYLRITE